MRITDNTLAIACQIPSDGTVTENTIHDLSLDLRDARARIARYEAALTLLTNGFKYSTEVVTIARSALAQTPSTRTGPYTGDYDDLPGDRTASEAAAQRGTAK